MTDREMREALAGIDMTKEFALHDYVIHDVAADGSATWSVPWSGFRFEVAADTTDVDARRAFNRAYVALVDGDAAEMAALREATIAAGFLPLSERMRRTDRTGKSD